MTEKLNKIFELTYDGSFLKVNLKDGRQLECKADCFCEADEEGEEYIPELLVIASDGSSEILKEDEIKSIEK